MADGTSEEDESFGYHAFSYSRSTAHMRKLLGFDSPLCVQSIRKLPCGYERPPCKARREHCRSPRESLLPRQDAREIAE